MILNLMVEFNEPVIEINLSMVHTYFICTHYTIVSLVVIDAELDRDDHGLIPCSYDREELKPLDAQN
jgi:hypothetical protein